MTPTSSLSANGQSHTQKSQPSGFRLLEKTVENFRPMKIIVIGAGPSGICAGIRIPEKLKNTELVIYDKNEGVGGVWWENRYLGCACDVPAHSYQYAFEPNPNWSQLYAPAREIQQYFERVARKYSVDRFLKLSHEVTECRWDSATAKWHVTVKNLTTGDIIHDTSDVLISAKGNLNTPSWPDIPGLHTFEGQLMHSAKWNENYDFSNKRVGLIGNGSSAIQILPHLQRMTGTHVLNFARSKTWISPPFSQELFRSYGFDGTAIPQETRNRFVSDPEYYHQFRLAVEEDTTGIHPSVIKGTTMQIETEKAFYDHMKKRLASHPEIFNTIIPSFPPGCRRVTPGIGYLEALVKPNVSFLTAPIVRFSKKAVYLEDGSSHEVDALVCATGFKTAAAFPFPTFGVNGLSLAEKWEHRSSTYLGITTASFPNFFLLLGPNANLATGALLSLLEAQLDYVIKCTRKLQKENIARIQVKDAREQDFIEYTDEYFKATVFAEDCRSWYKNKDGKVTGLWPGSPIHCLETLRSPRWEDFEYTYVEELEQQDRERNSGKTGSGTKTKTFNQLAWLGNGWSTNQIEGRDTVWYLYPEFVQKPTSPRPEEHALFKIRAFSY
ncbi:FAD/NAD(P)-binding domain-containing protein [Corynespora cassiicola Philippines]|uniref:FAD/NAD(P)-binding domain-containing protein n=1 Tax=Corynespora cassiicola Philippines TaxID=1448308 RepID=A0A2T2P2V4_CORCC|nr:FAD/NAD(P)-binding domain-containing protein [Corynespora cassiicola Philippines]